MPYTVEISFRGLCAFVPGGDLGKEMDWLGVMLVNAVDANRKTFQIEEKVHFPFVVYDVDDIEQKGGEGSRGLLPLDEYDVVVIPGSSKESKVVVDYRGLSKQIPGPGESEAFDWVPAMEDVMMRRGALDPALLKPVPYGGGESKLAARFHIRRGNVLISKTSEFEGYPVILELGDSGKRQVLATEVKVVMTEVTGQFVVKARSFKDNKIVRNIAFKEKQAGETLKISISNLCGENFCQYLLKQEPAGALPEPDADFRWHYVLSAKGAKPPQERLVPVPVRFARPTGGGGGEPARCSPPRFDQATTSQVGDMLGVASAVEQA